MIVAGSTHQRALDELATERGRREELTRRCDVQQTMIDFLITRVNQVEKERAMMFRQLTNIDIPIPSYTSPRASEIPTDPLEALRATASIFEDDPRHAPAGFHQDGSVNYGQARKAD